MRKSMLCLLPVIAVLSCGAQDPAFRYALDTQGSDVKARVAFFGLASKTARFPDISGSFAVTPTDIGSARMDVDIDARSLTTGDGQTAILRGRQFFDVKRYPTLHFSGQHMEMTGDRTATIDGAMTAHGVTRPIRLAITFATPPMETGGTQPIALVGTTSVDRYAYGMRAFPLIVGRMVNVTIRARMVPLS